MIRKFNYTNRKKINRESVGIILNHDKKEKYFEAQLNLSNGNFPDHAKVYIEAYYKTSYMRFNYGSISNICAPPSTKLNDFVNTDLIYFRIKIVDETKITGRILGLVSGIEPKNLESDQKNRMAILKVNYDADLGQRLYNLEFDEIEDFPILEINRKLENGSELVKSDIFLSTIYPSVIKDVATEIVNDQDSWQEDDDCWQGYWIKFFKMTLEINSLRPNYNEEEETKREWVDEVVNAFCYKYKVRSHFSSIKFN